MWGTHFLYNSKNKRFIQEQQSYQEIFVYLVSLPKFPILRLSPNIGLLFRAL